MKIAILGVGSFVFGPSVLHDAIVHRRFDGVHLALFDPNRQSMELMAGVARQMARDVGLTIQVTCHDSQTDAIDAADFVVSSAAVQVQKRFATDCQIILDIYPEHLITEFGGVAGISHTLRQVALVRRTATDMMRHCPGAWLLTSSNPLPRVCQAAQQTGIKTAGFCSNSSQVYEALSRVLLGFRESYPWPRAAERFEPVMAGVNHFTWLLQLYDRSSGADVTSDFTARLLAGEGGIARERPMSIDMLRNFGLYPPNGDAHMADFVVPTGQVKSLQESTHGSAEEREARQRRLANVGAGETHYSSIMDHRAWEMPMDFVAGIAGGASVRFNSLNLSNQTGQLPQMPKQVFVETPVRIENGRLIPATHTVPEKVATACRATAEISDVLTRAACEQDRSLLAEAVQRDPTILDKKRGMQAVDACIKAHGDLIGEW